LKKILNALGKFYKWTTTWTGAIVVVLIIISFVAQSFVIPSGSMIRTLLIGDYLFVKKFAYGTPTPHLPWVEIPLIPSVGLKLFDGDKPQRGDIVVFRKPGQENVHFVKRCVATGGDYIGFINKDLYLRPVEGDKFINENYSSDLIVNIDGKLWVKNPYRKDFEGIWNDPKVVNDGTQPERLFNMKPSRVPDDNYYMVGDNRDHSNDSRFWGSVPYENIEGTPWVIYFSIDENLTIRWDRMFRSVDSLQRDLGN
jgi:signal peptidase I